MSKLHNIFVYGTLMNREVRNQVVGAYKTTYSEVLDGYKRVGLNIVEDETSEVSGVTFEVTDEELQRLDNYEGVAVNLYNRNKVVLSSGEEAWVYTKCDPERNVIGMDGTIG